jgi:alpha-D-ribose 1-methylphosphonate 5-triphosphate synthase subunit PhnI
MYVAVKGGERAILNSHKLLAEERRGDAAVPELSLAQISGQLGLAVDRVMTEGSMPRFGFTKPIDTAQMTVRRRVSATFKDLPGGQVLGPTFDYTHRLLDFSLADGAPPPDPSSRRAERAETPPAEEVPHVLELLNKEGLIEQEQPGDDPEPPCDLTREPLEFPAARPTRLQNLARGDEGFLLALGYSTQRGFGNAHPFVGEVRQGDVTVSFVPEDLGFEIEIAEIGVTECEMVNQFKGSKTKPPQFTRGYGLTFGHCERKAMSMALVDRALRAEELGEARKAPAQDEEFVLYHTDNVEASGFVQHLKLPHYVDFQSELELIRGIRETAAQAVGDEDDDDARPAFGGGSV